MTTKRIKVQITLEKGKRTFVNLPLPVDSSMTKNWSKISADIPRDDRNAEGMFTKLADFWDDCKKNNPLWIPFSLSIGDVDEIQTEINRLTEKARKREPFEQCERGFLVALYSWIAWGGLLKWYPEACQLLRHYLHGNGKPVQLNPHIYESSIIVKYAMTEMKKIIIEDIKKTGKIRGNGAFSSQGNLVDTPCSFSDQSVKGAIVKNGTLMAEQNNQRLKNADNCFPLEAICSIISDRPPRFHIKWAIKSYWDYESFETQKTMNLNLVTKLPLGDGKKLDLPDGLSKYLVELRQAYEFAYSTEWHEDWTNE
jgi:hypothetical protein